MRNRKKLAAVAVAACGLVGAAGLPAVADVPGYSITRVADNALRGCSGGGTHWLGLDSFTASDWVQVPSGANSQYHLRLLEDGVSAPVFSSDTSAFSGPEVTNLPASDFVDDKGYSWKSGIDVPGGGIQWTAPCHFKVDHTPPPVPTAVLDDQYVGQPSPPPRRTPRRIKLSVPKGSELLGFCYAFGVGPTPSVPSAGSACGDQWAPVQADGTAFVTVRPLDPPFDELVAWSVDRAHNQSQSSTLQVSMQWGGVDKPGDITGDGKVDLVSVLNGQVRFNAGKGNGWLGATQLSRTGLPTKDFLLARVGPLFGSGNNGMLAMYNGVLASLGGDGVGDFPQQGCCLYSPDGQNWSDVTQLTGALNVAGAGSAGFVAVRGGSIQYYAATQFFVRPAVTLGKADQATQLIGVQDFNADGKPDLLVREGKALKLFAGKGDGTFAAPVVFAKSLDLSELADITSDGDANGDGKPDLWATTTTGALVFIPGHGAAGFGKPLVIAKSGWKGVQLD